MFFCYTWFNGRDVYSVLCFDHFFCMSLVNLSTIVVYIFLRLLIVARLAKVDPTLDVLYFESTNVDPSTEIVCQIYQGWQLCCVDPKLAAVLCLWTNFPRPLVTAMAQHTTAGTLRHPVK